MNLRPPGYEPDELPTALLRDIHGAGDRGRTGTGLLPRDFKSLASANSATPANGWRGHLNGLVILTQYNPTVNPYFKIYFQQNLRGVICIPERTMLYYLN